VTSDLIVPRSSLAARETVASPPLIRETVVSPPLKVHVETAIAHGRRHYSASGEPLATTLAVLECPQREGFVAVDEPET
jgi:hypothetical protein